MTSITPSEPTLCIVSENNRIFFKKDYNAPSLSRGIKKAGFIERLFGKATKLSFDGGKTTTVVNTNSLIKYIFKSSGFQTYLKNCDPEKKLQHSSFSRLIASNGTHDKKIILMNVNKIFFSIFKQTALTDAIPSYLAPSALGKTLRKFVTNADQLRTSLDEKEQIKYFQDKTLKNSSSETKVNDNSGKEDCKTELTKLCKAILEFSEKKKAQNNKGPIIIKPEPRTNSADASQSASSAAKVAALAATGGILGFILAGPLGSAVGAAAGSAVGATLQVTQ